MADVSLEAVEAQPQETDMQAEPSMTAVPLARPPLKRQVTEQEKRVHDSDERSRKSSIGKVMIVLLTIILALWNLISAIARVLFNMTFIASSFAALTLPTAPLPEWKLSIELSLGPLGKVMTWFLQIGYTVVDAIDLPSLAVTFNINCGTTLKLVSAGLMLAFSYLVAMFVGRGWLFYLTITSKRVTRSRPILQRLMFSALVQAGVGALYYCIQVSVLFMYKLMVRSATSRGGSCSALDDSFGAILQWTYLLIFINVLLWFVSFFAGRRDGALRLTPAFLIGEVVSLALSPKKKMQYLTDIIVLVRLSFGVWNDHMVENFEIKENAEKWDDDDTDDDNQHQKVLAIIGRAHGLFWILVPGMVLLAKMAEFLNNPPLSVYTFQKQNNLKLKQGFCLRKVLYLFNAFRLLIMLVFIFAPSAFLVLVLSGTLVPETVTQFIDDLKDNMGWSARSNSGGGDGSASAWDDVPAAEASQPSASPKKPSLAAPQASALRSGDTGDADAPEGAPEDAAAPAEDEESLRVADDAADEPV